MERETESVRASSRRGSSRRASEGDILSAARAGDRDAFDRLAVGVLPILLGTARRLLRDPSDAEEAVAEALLKGYERLEDFRGDSAFGTWVHRILCRVAADRCRREARETRRLLVLAGRTSAASPDPSPLQGLAGTESRARVRAAVEALPPTQRLVVVLSAWEGLSLEEIGRVLSMRYATVKSNLHHARGALRERLGLEDVP